MTFRWAPAIAASQRPRTPGALAHRSPPLADHRTRQRPGDDRDQRGDALWPRVAAQRLRVRVHRRRWADPHPGVAQSSLTSTHWRKRTAGPRHSMSPPGSSGPLPPDPRTQSGRDRPMRTIAASPSCNAPRLDPPARYAAAPASQPGALGGARARLSRASPTAAPPTAAIDDG